MILNLLRPPGSVLLPIFPHLVTLYLAELPMSPLSAVIPLPSAILVRVPVFMAESLLVI